MKTIPTGFQDRAHFGCVLATEPGASKVAAFLGHLQSTAHFVTGNAAFCRGVLGSLVGVGASSQTSNRGLLVLHTGVPYRGAWACNCCKSAALEAAYRLGGLRTGYGLLQRPQAGRGLFQ